MPIGAIIDSELNQNYSPRRVEGCLFLGRFQRPGQKWIAKKKVLQLSQQLEKVQKDAPDLVIVDLVMPQMNGYELCRFLKNNPTTQQIPVLICSTKSQDFDRYWGMKQGADAYLTKPFQPAELLRTIEVLLENSKADS